MSTRSTVHFVDEYDEVIVYVHHDGYLTGRGEQLLRFVERLQGLRDSRLSEASGTAAKFVAFMFEEYQKDLGPASKDFEGNPRPERDPLETISIRIMGGDPGDIEFRYFVRGEAITYQKVTWTESGSKFSREEPVTRWFMKRWQKGLD